MAAIIGALVLCVLWATVAVCGKPAQLGTSCARHFAYTRLAELYLHAVKMSVSGVALETPAQPFDPAKPQPEPYNGEKRALGQDWPKYGITMVGLKRLEHIHEMLLRLEEKGIAGDFVECGVWRGGSSVFAKAVVTAYHMQRRVILVDSFNGLPPATVQAKDGSDAWQHMAFLRVSQEQVQRNFKKFNLLDDDVEFNKGFFNESLPPLAAQLKQRGSRIAYLRLDGDMYESTMDELYNLYEFVPVGGVVVVDDWAIMECQNAVNDFQKLHGMSEKIVDIDGTASYWIKTTDVTVQKEWYEDFNKKRFGAKTE